MSNPKEEESLHNAAVEEYLRHIRRVPEIARRQRVLLARVASHPAIRHMNEKGPESEKRLSEHLYAYRSPRHRGEDVVYVSVRDLPGFDANEITLYQNPPYLSEHVRATGVDTCVVLSLNVHADPETREEVATFYRKYPSLGQAFLTRFLLRREGGEGEPAKKVIALPYDLADDRPTVQKDCRAAKRFYPYSPTPLKDVVNGMTASDFKLAEGALEVIEEQLAHAQGFVS